MDCGVPAWEGSGENSKYMQYRVGTFMGINSCNILCLIVDRQISGALRNQMKVTLVLCSFVLWAPDLTHHE